MPGRCLVCAVPLVGTYTWATMTPEKRVGKAVHQGKSLCQKHYSRARRHGSPVAPRPAWKPRPPRTASLPAEEILEEWVTLRRSGESVASAAERLGVTYAALDKLLWRARQRGDARAALPQERRAS